MRQYLRLALREQWEGNQFFVLMGVFVGLGLFTVLVTFYVKDILKSAVGMTPAVLNSLPIPSWYTLCEAVYQNNIQINLLVVAFVMAKACTPGKSASALAFYGSNLPRAGSLFLARGLAVILYMTVAYFVSLLICGVLIEYLAGGFPLIALVFFGFWQLMAMIMICWLSAAAAVWVRRFPVIGVVTALAVVVLIFNLGPHFQSGGAAQFFDAFNPSMRGFSPHSMLGGLVLLMDGILFGTLAVYLRPLRSEAHIVRSRIDELGSAYPDLVEGA